MTEKIKKPQIRFKEFNDAWEQSKLVDMCFLITKQTGFDYTATIKPALLTEPREDTYSFIQNKDFDGENINFDTDFYIPISVAKKYPKITLDCPSLLISISGKIGNIGYYNKNNKAFIGGAVGICKLIKSNGSSIVYALQSDAGQAYFHSLIKASSHANITVADIRNITVSLPKSESEEKMLVNFFHGLDNLITLHQLKLEKIKNVKKSMLEKIFPKNGEDVPEIRFRGFSDTWEQRKLGDHCEMYNGDRGINYPNDKDMVSDGIAFINAGDLKNGRVNLSTSNKISREKYNQLGGAKLQLGDIVYCLRGTLGKNAFIDNFDEGTVASSLVALRPKNMDNKYLFHILNSDIEFRQRTVCDEGAAQPNLSAKNLGGFDIPVPKFEEQKQISFFLDNLDNLLTLHQRKLDKLKNIKKSMLEKMFI